MADPNRDPRPTGAGGFRGGAGAAGGSAGRGAGGGAGRPVPPRESRTDQTERRFRQDARDAAGSGGASRSTAGGAGRPAPSGRSGAAGSGAARGEQRRPDVDGRGARADGRPSSPRASGGAERRPTGDGRAERRPSAGSLPERRPSAGTPSSGRPAGGRPDRPGGRTAGTPTGRAAGPASGSGSSRAGARGGSAAGPGGAPRRGATREEIAQREYDPRREERRKATRVALPDDVDPRMLDGEARRELRSLSKETAELVARHLVVTGQLLDDDPERALAHARAARALAGRVGVVREAVGLAAYAAGEWAEALSELRAARRITGRPEHLAVFADCERALGRPERALAYADDPQVDELSQDQRVELVIVLAGARRDLGQADAGVLLLQDPARRTSDKRPWAARLWYAYADALLEAGREDQAREWFAQAAAVDVDGQTDAGDRLLALEGIVLEDDDEDDEEREDLLTPDELAALVKDVPVPTSQGQASAAGDAGTSGGAGSAGAADDAGIAAHARDRDDATAVPAAPVEDVATTAATAGEEPGQRSADAHAAALFRPAAETTDDGGTSTAPGTQAPDGAAARARTVAPPVFVAAPDDGSGDHRADDSDGGEDLRLFD